MTVLSKALKAISITFKGMNDRVKFKSLSKESIVAQVEDVKAQLTSVQGTIFSLNKTILEDAYAKASTLSRTDKDTAKALGKGSSILPSLSKKLAKVSGKLKNGVFGPMIFTSRVCIKNMQDILQNVDTIVGSSNGFIVGETKVSQGVFLGVLEASKLFSRYNMYLIALVSHINSGSSNDMPKYMLTYLENNLDNYAAIVNSISLSSGKHSVMNDIAGIKSSGLDLRFYIDKNNTAASQSRLITDVLGIENIFVTLFNIAIVPIALIGEVYIDARHQYYADMGEQKKWLETHVANLRMEMAEDATGKEKAQAKKAIAYYEDKIAKIDKKTDAYYNS